MDNDPQVVCDACDGRGRHYDRWGSWDCWLCQGLGYRSLSSWQAYVLTFPVRIQRHLLAHHPPLRTLGPQS